VPTLATGPHDIPKQPATLEEDTVTRWITAHAAVAAVATAAAAFGPTARAADKLPPQGIASYVSYYTARPLSVVDMGELGSQAVSELVGLTRNTGGVAKAFDNMSARCISHRETLGGRTRIAGSCIETDNDGDKVFTTFEGTSHTIVGGTGKYKGLTGVASYTVVPAPPAAPGVNVFAADHKVTWKFDGP
jgi:hypothetical protein